MIAFNRSSFLWKSHPWEEHPYYKYNGGFVGKYGQAYQVRFHLEASCMIIDNDVNTTVYLGAPCRTEFTIAREDLFQVPSGEWRMAFTDDMHIPISKKPSDVEDPLRAGNLEEQFESYRIDIRKYRTHETITDAVSVVTATMNNNLLNGVTTYRDDPSGLTVRVEYPVDLINLNENDGEFQVCTGPVILPDLTSWDGRNVHRTYLADVAISDFDYAEFILRREIEPADHERVWFEKTRGRDRYELIDPEIKPPDFTPSRPKPMVYNEVWKKNASNLILSAPNE